MREPTLNPLPSRRACNPTFLEMWRSNAMPLILRVSLVAATILLCLAYSAKAQELYESDTGDNTIFKFTPGGVKSTFATNVGDPQGLAFDSNGNLFVADAGKNNSIFKYTPDGVESTFATGLGKPEGLAFDSDGNLFVGDNADSNIYMFTPGGLRSTFASGLFNPSFLAFSPSGGGPATPEPGSLTLLGGLAGTGAFLTLRRRIPL